MAEKIRIAVMLLALCWIAVQDIKRKSIGKMELLVVFGAILCVGLTEPVAGWLRVGGAVFGVLVLCICRLSQEALGSADGVMILAYGIAFGLLQVALLCFLSFLFSAAVAGVLYLMGKIGRKGRIPFLPFYLAGYIVSLVL